MRSKVLFCDPYGGYLTWSAEVRAAGAGWDLVRVDSLSSASDLIKENVYSAVIVATLSSPDRELAFLRGVSAKYPQMARILYAPVLTPNLLSRSLDVVHRVCLNTEPVAQLIQQVDQSIESTQQILSPRVRRSLAAFKKLPSPPSVFAELTELFNSAQTTSTHIAAVVSKDPALAAQLLRLVNSSYFSLPNPVSNIQQAVTLLGVRTLRALALAGHLGRHYRGLQGWDEFSLSAWQARALMVARLAQQLAKTVSPDPLLRDQAFLSGLLLDVGMLMLASEQSSGYSKVIHFASKRDLDLASVETRAFGVNHAQLAAALFSQWNLAPLVVDAVLYHSSPSEYAQEGLTPLALAHVADALLPPLLSKQGQALTSQLDEAYLRENALDQYLPQWRMAANGFRLQSQRAAASA